MSVEQYGARLLDEVQEESLDELLRELRTTIHHTPKDVLGFSQVDKLLELFRYHQRNTTPRRPGWTLTSDPGQAFSDNEVDYYQADPDHFDIRMLTQSKQRPPVIEITSIKSAAGKTTLLYQLAAHALLPHEHGGKGSAVVWFDTDNSFSATRLAQVAAHVVNKANPQPAAATDDMITTSLQHLYILKPTSSTALLDALHSLTSHLLTHTSQTSPSRPLALLMLDSATAFTHQDRFDADIARLEAGPNASTSTSHSHLPPRTSQIITALRQIQHEFECTIILTTVPQQTHTHHHHHHHYHQPYYSNSLKRPLPPSSDHAAAPATPSIPAEPPSQTPWTSFATLTLHISRIPVAQFAPNMTLDECVRDSEKRQEAVVKGRFAVGLDWKGSGMWPPGVKDVVMGGMEGRGAFVVRIGELGLDVEGVRA